MAPALGRPGGALFPHLEEPGTLDRLAQRLGWAAASLSNVVMGSVTTRQYGWELNGMGKSQVASRKSVRGP